MNFAETLILRLNFAETIETLGMHIVLEIPHKNEISSDSQHITSNAIVFANRVCERNEAV